MPDAWLKVWKIQYQIRQSSKVPSKDVGFATLTLLFEKKEERRKARQL